MMWKHKDIITDEHNGSVRLVAAIYCSEEEELEETYLKDKTSFTKMSNVEMIILLHSFYSYKCIEYLV
jgi:hypothetical protein